MWWYIGGIIVSLYVGYVIGYVDALRPKERV
jgi:hypothetical protein